MYSYLCMQTLELILSIWSGELSFHKLFSPFPVSIIRVSGECKTKLYKGLNSGLASVSQTVKDPRGKVLNLASLHMALTVMLCELWWHHGILWHHCSDSLLLPGIQYIVFVQTQEPFVEKEAEQLSSAWVQMWTLLEGICSVSRHKVAILLSWPEHSFTQVLGI